MQRLLLALGTALGVTLLLAATASAQAPSPSAASATPGQPPEPPAVRAPAGVPTVTATHPPGYYIAVEGNRVLLRTTDPGGDSSTYTGVIRVNGSLANVDLFQPEDPDWAVAAGNEINFHFQTRNQVDGVSFTALDTTRVTFHLYRNGHEISTRRIYLGGTGTHPPGNPFALFIN